MPENLRFGNNLFDRKCSKCKRIQEPQYYELRNVVFRTCNNCRFKAYQRTHPSNTLADFNRGTARVIDISHYLDTETDSERVIIQIFNGPVSLSSSAAAASCDSHLYFVEEPEP